MLDAKKQKIVIWILSVFGFLMSALIVPLFFAFVIVRMDQSVFEPGILLVRALVNLIFWVPVTLIVFRILKKSGFKGAVIFVIAAIVGTSLLSRGCF